MRCARVTFGYKVRANSRISTNTSCPPKNSLTALLCPTAKVYTPEEAPVATVAEPKGEKKEKRASTAHLKVVPETREMRDRIRAEAARFGHRRQGHANGPRHCDQALG